MGLAWPVHNTYGINEIFVSYHLRSGFEKIPLTHSTVVPSECQWTLTEVASIRVRAVPAIQTRILKTLVYV